MTTDPIALLDVTDTHARRLQLSGLGLGLSLVLVGALMRVGLQMVGPGWAAGIVGLVLAGLGAAVKQRWVVEYEGHRIRFENSAVFGEKLFVDDVLVARGGYGSPVELWTEVTAEDGSTHGIRAVAEMDITWFRCRIVAEPDPESVSPPAPGPGRR